MTFATSSQCIALAQPWQSRAAYTDSTTARRTRLYRIMLCVMFMGCGASCVIRYLAIRLAPGVPDWTVERFPLLVTLPPLFVGVCWYARFAGFAKSKTLIVLALWMLLSLAWVDPTERGRGFLAAVVFGVTLPLTSVIRRTRSERDCALWFAMSYVGSLLLVIVTGPESGGRFGDFAYDGLTLTNSNQVGLVGVLVAVLMYGFISENRRRRGMDAVLKQRQPICFPVTLAVASAALALATVSRTAGVCLGVALILIWHRHASRKHAWLFATPLVVVSAALVLVVSGFATTWQARISDSDVQTLNGRTEIWNHLWALNRRSTTACVAGIGFGGVDKILGAELQAGAVHPVDGILRLHSHNLYLEWAAELGAVALVLVGLLMIRAFRVGRALDRMRGSVLRTCLLTIFFLWGMAGVPTENPAFPALGALLWALLSPDLQTTGVSKNGCLSRH